MASRWVLGGVGLVAVLVVLAAAAGTGGKMRMAESRGGGAMRVVGEDYVYSCIGNCMQRRTAQSSPGVVLHGGGVDIPAVYYWMVERAGGGDFLVLSATTAYNYNDPIWAASQGQLNSVATLVFLNASAATDPWVISTIQEASGIFFSGGDQWKYYSFWKMTPTYGAIMQHVGAAPVGGSSAGMAILGEIVNTAQWLRNVSLSTRETLANPYTPLLTLGTDFLQVPFLENVVTETHFRERNRMGRVVSFMARMAQDILSRSPRGIACDADAAVLLYPNGTASTIAWTANDACYFLELTQPPTECQPGASLSISGVKVVRLRGNLTNAFDLAAWQPSNGAGAFTYSLAASHGRLSSSGNNGKIY